MKRALMLLTAAALVFAMTACGAAPEAPVSAADSADASAAEPAAEGAVYKVGIVKFVDDASLDQIEKAIQTELDAKGAELGVTFDYAQYTKNGQADSTTLNQIAADLIADQVDVIVPIATPAALIMQAATEENQIPVVFSAVSDPVGAGLVNSLEAPGSNVTGTSDALNVEAVIDLMLAANPDIKKLGLLYNQGEDASKSAIESARSICGEKSIETVEKTGTTNDELAMAADALVAEQVDAVFTPTDNTVMTAELAIYEKFVDAKIPHYAGADSFALNGAFCGYGVNYVTLGTATADMVVDILVNGAKPAETPVQIMSSGIAMVNTETASAIGLDYSAFASMCEEVKETTTQESFE
ncbi:MAG: ABC transporter substrate-binding protein [Oscillospiraceae bacterium]|nr:ABC transporter substrate-binding protein [Oscillospiraceae bacterium]